MSIQESSGNLKHIGFSEKLEIGTRRVNLSVSSPNFLPEAVSKKITGQQKDLSVPRMRNVSTHAQGERETVSFCI